MSHQRVWIVIHDFGIPSAGRIGARVYNSSDSAKASVTFFARRIELGIANWRWRVSRWVLTDDDFGRVATVEQRQVWP